MGSCAGRSCCPAAAAIFMQARILSCVPSSSRVSRSNSVPRPRDPFQTRRTPNMMRKLLQRFQSAYKPVLVLLIVSVAMLLIYALYRATGGGGFGAGMSIVASFDDVTGIKERSKVLFKGMPVGSV